MPKRVRDKRPIIVFKAFFDESGTDPIKNKALVVGGFLGRAEEWERASDAWDECLHAAPRIEYFKHNEAQSLDGQFEKFNRGAADKKVLALANTISQFDLQGFCVSVSYRLFKHRNVKASKGQVGAKVYDWGFLAATSGVLQHLGDTAPDEGEKVDFVFDERRELRACIDMFSK